LFLDGDYKIDLDTKTEYGGILGTIPTSLQWDPSPISLERAKFLNFWIFFNSLHHKLSEK
jgi:hypothetical protein